MTTSVDPIALIRPFAQSDWQLAVIQLVNTLIPYGLLWVLAAWTLKVSLLLTLLICMIAAGFYVRIFILFHDCGHGSFTPSKRFNESLGFVLGVLFFVPYRLWTDEHALHHATAGNLDRRGRGDVWMMTLAEYQAASPWLQRGYRLYRSPLIMFLADMILGFVVLFRLPQTGKTPAAQQGIVATNVALVCLWGLLSLWVGLPTILIVQGSIFVVGASIGVFLFFVQHMFEGTYWVRDHEWDFRRAAMEGSSFFDLPRILHFFTGNIGYHHIHHLNPKVPNYRLRAAHNSHPIFSTAKALRLGEALSTFQLKLWDEQTGKFCSFSEV